METLNSTGALICFAILIAMSYKQGNGVSAQDTISIESSSSANSISSSYSTDTSVTLDLKPTESTKDDFGTGDNMQSTAVSITSISKPSEMSYESNSAIVTTEPTTVLSSTGSISTSHTSTIAEISAITKSAESTTQSETEEFHVIMIVMIVLLGFIIIFSVLCGVLTIFGIDIGCPIPCCGGGGGNKKPYSGISLKMSSKRSRNLSSQRLNEAEEFNGFDFGSSIKTSEPATQYNEGYDTYHGEVASPAYASSKITPSQDEPISVDL